MDGGEKEDLREFYITPFYLETMRNRARQWSSAFIQEQMELFHKTISDYPEVHEVLEGELYRRELETLRKETRRLSINELKKISGKYPSESDHAEIIRVEIKLRNNKG